MHPEIFFVLGCQRSGTTLLRLILESHPGVMCFDELKAYAMLQTYAGQGSHTWSELDPQKGHVGFKIPRWTEQFLDPEFRDEGQPEICRNFYRGEKIIFTIRDVRDVVVSMKKLKVGSAGTWLEFWPPRILLCKMLRVPHFRDRFHREFEILRDTTDSLTGIAALYWTYKTAAVLDYVRAKFPVLPLFYEELVTEPRRTLSAVCAHVDIPWDEQLLAHHELDHRELFADGMTLGGTDPKASISTRSVHQWEAALSPAELDLIDQIAGPTMVRLAALKTPAA